jgi:anti-sigma factor RsiW
VHLGACPECAEQVRAVLALNEALAGGLAAATPALPLDEALESARAEAGRRRSAKRRRHVWRALVPLAAAATIVGLLAVRSGGLIPGEAPDERSAVPVVAASSAAVDVDVTVPEGTNVAVFRTANPDIVVFWVYE